MRIVEFGSAIEALNKDWKHLRDTESNIRQENLASAPAHSDPNLMLSPSWSNGDNTEGADQSEVAEAFRDDCLERAQPFAVTEVESSLR